MEIWTESAELNAFSSRWQLACDLQFNIQRVGILGPRAEEVRVERYAPLFAFHFARIPDRMAELRVPGTMVSRAGIN